MSRIKKLTLILLAIILVMIINVKPVNATSRYFSYEDLCTNEKLLCTQHHQWMYGGNYNLSYTIEILGDTSTGNGKTYESWHNAKLASILSHPRGQGDLYGDDVEQLPVQNAIWHYFNNWMEEVGTQHGLNFSVNGPANTVPFELIEEAEQYASNYNKNSKLTDKTDKSKIKVISYKENNQNKLRIGPFKYEFTGKLSQIQLATDKNNNVGISSFEKKTGQNDFTKYSRIEDIKSNDEIYLTINMPTDGAKEITKIKVKSNTDEKYVKINFWEDEWGTQQNLIEYEYETRPLSIENEFTYNIKLFGNLKVIKVNKDNETIKLANVGFYIQNKDTGKYINRDKGIISYVDKDKATEFATDRNGEIRIDNLIVGTYVAYETKNPNYGYEIVNNGAQANVVVDKTAELKILNKQKYIKLSGYVWVDKVSGKRSERDYLYYNNGDLESDDALLDGITVRLKNRATGAVVKETKTANGGAYKFVDVLVDDLDKYYVEFEYDGLTYQNVVPHTNKNNGSKVAEGENTRTSFNNNFAIVEGKSSNQSMTRDISGNEKHTITYTTENHEAKVDKSNSYYGITSNTDETGYKVKDHFTYGQEEIKNINLGLYEREMPDIRLEKDVENVELSINGFHHVYEYGSKNLNNYNVEKDEKDFNVGVKFASEYKGTYKRAVYEPDYNYTLVNQDKDSKLNVYLTYRIAMYNESTTLKTRINSIVDYFDKNFIIEKAGTGINKETGEITGDITYQKDSTGDYNKVIIQNNTEIDSEKTDSIYVRFKLSDNEVLKAFNDVNEKVTYKNIAEVNSYSVFRDGKVYAGIDKDSAPANIVPGDINTYEDDTNRAPGMQLEVDKNTTRTLTGNVFLDESTGGIAQVRLGDGIYDTSKEHGIAGVNVKLTEVNEDGTKKQGGQEYTCEPTGEDGRFEIKDFIPGNYILTYTWGDKTYTVQNYKGTIWNDKNRTEKEQNGVNWYKVNVDTRYSDAMDNWETRQKIDAGEKITTMDSTTPTMALSLEVNSVYSIVPDVDEFVSEGYEIKNIDFGIVERARQEIDLEKRIKTFKASLANGQVIADVTVNKDGSLTGERNHVTYMGPSDKTLPKNGYIKLELDNELIQGTKVEVNYEITATNNSEVEYLSENYYKYGIQEGEVVKISPVQVIDYLDSSWGFETTRNPEWSVKTLDEIKDKVSSIVYEDQYSTIANKTILYTESFNQKLKPTESISKDIYVSKQLANSDEISLDNEVEIVKVEKTGGADLKSIPGNYIPGTEHQEADDALAETVIITPNTGDNLNFVIPVMVGVTALIILGVGIILIKKKTL